MNGDEESFPHALDRPTTLELARLLNEVVVSGDRIGSAYHDDESIEAELAPRYWRPSA